jgi:hypothetical protein
MTPLERGGLQKTLIILHALEALGIVKQVLGEDMLVRWVAVGSETRYAAVLAALATE